MPREIIECESLDQWSQGAKAPPLVPRLAAVEATATAATKVRAMRDMGNLLRCSGMVGGMNAKWSELSHLASVAGRIGRR